MIGLAGSFPVVGVSQEQTAGMNYTAAQGKH